MLSILIAAPVFAHECINASKKDQAAGAQIVFGPNGEVLYINEGLQTESTRASSISRPVRVSMA